MLRGAPRQHGRPRVVVPGSSSQGRRPRVAGPKAWGPSPGAQVLGPKSWISVRAVAGRQRKGREAATSRPLAPAGVGEETPAKWSACADRTTGPSRAAISVRGPPGPAPARCAAAGSSQHERRADEDRQHDQKADEAVFKRSAGHGMVSCSAVMVTNLGLARRLVREFGRSGGCAPDHTPKIGCHRRFGNE